MTTKASNFTSMELMETACLGIELGSTRIKSVLIGADHRVLASGSHDWENRMENGYWTYRLEDVWIGIQQSCRSLFEQVQARYGVALTKVGAIGISAMMHGYLPFDQDGALLAPFRTWRNTTTGDAAQTLTKLFDFSVPQRWSIAHLYQAMLNGEPHVSRIDFLTTLAGYVHWQLTGQKVLGVGDASGMMPLDRTGRRFSAEMIEKFNALSASYPWQLQNILPAVLLAGQPAGVLTEAGARLLDPDGVLQAGIPLCPPEGDAGTGMVATNSVSPRTGNVSAGTSIFMMIALEKPLTSVYEEIDMVATPAGDAVAMVHCNTCTTDLDAWVHMLGEMAAAVGVNLSKTRLYSLFFQKALEGETDGGGLINYNYYSGEPITGLSEGRPLFLRRSDARLTLANFARTQIYSALATLKLGMDILQSRESVGLDTLVAHGGLFKTPLVAQKILSDALDTPVSVMETASEGGPWGMALLARYMLASEPGESLADYLKSRVFSGQAESVQLPEPKGADGFARFMKDYCAGLAAEKAAVSALTEKEERESI